MADSPRIAVAPFGVTPAGDKVDAVTLTNAAGMTVRLMTLGATIQSVLVPDRHGTLADVTLGHASAAEYCTSPHYFGASIGRVANRLATGRCPIDGQTHSISCNDGANALHGGQHGFDKRIWSIVELRDGERPGVTLQLISPDGDQGFPGTLTVIADVDLDDENRLEINYRATTDRATAVNLTNHAYWNLGGVDDVQSALDHVLTIPAQHFLATDDHLIPTGEFVAVAGTPFDFRTARPIGQGIRDATHRQIAIGRGYDHNWVLDPADGLRRAARLVDPGSGRVLELWTNKPGVQFYSGNFLDGGHRGKSDRFYRMGDGIALEPQDFPDTPNHPAFGSITLAPGDTYHHQIVYAFSNQEAAS